MKNKIWLAALGVLLTLSTHAQFFDRFRLGLGGGLAIPSAQHSGPGILLFVEPSYAVSEAVSVGIRAEWALLTVGLPDGEDYAASIFGTYTANMKYYLNKGNTRVFVGAGLGFYYVPGIQTRSNFDFLMVLTGDSGDGITAAETKFGYYPRIGIEFRRLTVSVDYNFIPSSPVIQPGFEGEVKNGYFGLHIGANLRAKRPGQR